MYGTSDTRRRFFRQSEQNSRRSVPIHGDLPFF